MDELFNQMMAARRAEWDALSTMHGWARNLSLTSPVDDDFPLLMDRYEESVKDFIAAHNQRIEAIKKVQEARAHAPSTPV